MLVDSLEVHKQIYDVVIVIFVLKGYIQVYSGALDKNQINHSSYLLADPGGFNVMKTYFI